MKCSTRIAASSTAAVIAWSISTATWGAAAAGAAPAATPQPSKAEQPPASPAPAAPAAPSAPVAHPPTQTPPHPVAPVRPPTPPPAGSAPVTPAQPQQPPQQPQGTNPTPPTSSPPTVVDDGRDHDRDDRRHRRLPWGVVNGNYGWPYNYGYGWTDPWSSYPPDSYTGTRGPDNDYSNPVQLPPNANDVQPAQPAAPAPAQPPGNSANTAAAQTANAVERSPELATANAAVQRAQAEYDAAVQAVRDKLQQNPDYQQAVERRKQAELQVHAVRHVDPAAPPAEVAPAAQAKLEAGDEVTRLGAAAIAADPTAAAAKTRLQDAVAKRDALRNQLMSQHQRGG